MIVRFTNVKNEVNYGIVIDTHVDGMKEVFWDEFTQLLARLESNGARIGDFVRAGLSKRKSWIRVEAALPPGASIELLPITTRVDWTDRDLIELQAQMKRGDKVAAIPDVVATELTQTGETSNVFRGQEVS